MSTPLPPPPALPLELRERATEAAPPADGIAEVLGRIDEITASVQHLAATVGELLDVAISNRTALVELRSVSGALASEQVTAHELIRRLPCRTDGLGCVARRLLALNPKGADEP